ncbi:MAG: hypothetical protein AB7D33_02640 [Sphingobium sp.]
MNPFEMVVVIVALVVLGRIVTARYGRSPATASSEAEVQHLRDEVRGLKERVAVLERLATDSTVALEREFEKLRDRG